jgi:adenosylhomocysteine nucleosidase
VSDAVLVCFALPDEACPFRKLAGQRADVRILETGMGRRNAAAALTQTLAASPPRLVLTCGFAGGLNPSLFIGDLIFEAEDDFPLRARLLATGARPARLHCADAIAATAQAKRRLHAATSADAVEMESGAIREVCRQAGVACATLRVISDTVREDLPFDFNQFTHADQSLNLPKLLLALAGSPSKLGGLLKLRRNCRFAANRLALALVSILAAG